MTRQIYGPYDEKPPVRFECTGPTMAKQSMAAECDINLIMAKYEKTGLISHVKEHGGTYGNFISDVDYHNGCNAIIAAQNMFESLPAGVRKKFDNDPANFLAFVQDPDKEKDLIEMGLASPRESPELTTQLKETGQEPPAPKKEPEAPPAAP